MSFDIFFKNSNISVGHFDLQMDPQLNDTIDKGIKKATPTSLNLIKLAKNFAAGVDTLKNGIAFDIAHDQEITESWEKINQLPDVLFLFNLNETTLKRSTLETKFAKTHTFHWFQINPNKELYSAYVTANDRFDPKTIVHHAGTNLIKITDKISNITVPLYIPKSDDQKIAGCDPSLNNVIVALPQVDGEKGQQGYNDLAQALKRREETSLPVFSYEIEESDKKKRALFYYGEVRPKTILEKIGLLFVATKRLFFAGENSTIFPSDLGLKALRKPHAVNFTVSYPTPFMSHIISAVRRVALWFNVKIPEL